MRRFFILSAVVAALFFIGCTEKKTSSSENWSGEVTVGKTKLNICFAIEALSDGKYKCTMDVPEQGAKGIPVQLTRNDSDSLNISIPALRATYKGRRVSAQSIEGVFTQNGVTLSLNLAPGKSEIKRPQTPSAPFAYKTEEVVFRNEAEDAELSGTLTYPVDYDESSAASVPVVLMITGSGAQDRNEEIMGHKPFLVIADFLAKNGIASLRYDDRGTGKSKGPTAGITTMNNLADAEAGITYLRSLGKFGKIGVIGHSEGGTIAFMMGACGSVDFIVSLAGSAANGIDMIAGQNEAILRHQGVPQNVVSDYIAALRLIYRDRVSRKEIVNKQRYVTELCKANSLSLPDNLKNNLVLCITSGGEWFTWFLGYSPAEAIGRIDCPVMALNGKMDMQVLCEDNIPVIKENLTHNGNNLIKEYDGLNHLFQHCTAANALDYGAIEETISQEVLEDIAEWINRIKQ